MKVKPLALTLSLWVVLISMSVLQVHAADSSYGRFPGAKSPTKAVYALVKPYFRPFKGGCKHPGAMRSCPVTTQFRNRIVNSRLRFDIVCRCQNIPRRVEIGASKIVKTLTGQTFGTVVTRWVFGPSSSLHITFVTEPGQSGWLVTDEYCTGNPRTSIFVARPSPCH